MGTLGAFSGLTYVGRRADHPTHDWGHLVLRKTLALGTLTIASPGAAHSRCKTTSTAHVEPQWPTPRIRSSARRRRHPLCRNSHPCSRVTTSVDGSVWSLDNPRWITRVLLVRAYGVELDELLATHMWHAARPITRRAIPSDRPSLQSSATWPTASVRWRERLAQRTRVLS